MKKKVLFVCRHNSARSQMTEAFLNQLGGDSLEAESAGLNPKTILHSAAAVMQEIGLYISNRPIKNVYVLHQSDRRFDYVITVCDEASGKQCPTFNSPCQHLHWTFPEPCSFNGSKEQIIEQTRQVRNQIRSKVIEWLTQFNPRTFSES